MLEKLNYKVNSKIDLGNGTINGQGTGQISKCRYGLFPASYNACEMIAIYNLLLLCGYEGHSFADICREMYPKTWAFCGLFGSNSFTLPLYFTKRQIPIRSFYRLDSFLKRLPTDKYGIISLWNANNPFKGIHTVCIEKTDAGYRVYNRANKITVPCDFYTIDNFVTKHRFICGYTIKRKK